MEQINIFDIMKNASEKAVEKEIPAKTGTTVETVEETKSAVPVTKAEEKKTEIKASVTKEAPRQNQRPLKKAVKVPKPVKPAILKDKGTLVELMQDFGMKTISFNNGTWHCYSTGIPRTTESIDSFIVNGAILTKVADPLKGNDIYIDAKSYNCNRATIPLVFKYIDPATGTYWFNSLKVERVRSYKTSTNDYTFGRMENWRVVEKIVGKGFFLPGSKEPYELLDKYQQDFADSHGLDAEFLADAPWLEILYKADYEFARRLVNGGCYIADQHKIDILNRLCKRGSKPADIFKTEPIIYKNMKGYTNLDYWDRYRILLKMGKLSKDSVVQCIEHDFDQNALRLISSILGQEYNGKKVFTFDSLINYLGRVDQFEAVCEDEALPLLYDYLNMCKQLEMPPRIDGDSLKREHDVAARNLRFKRNERLAKEMAPACEKLKVFDYENKDFLIRGVRSYDDLLDEAKQQHSCVASYSYAIKEGRSLIYVLRRKSAPNRSLVTVELSPTDFRIRQKLMAYNKKIYNKAITDFLDEWSKYVRAISFSRAVCGA